MGGAGLGLLHGHPSRHERRTGTLPRACRQRQIHRPHPDSHVPAAAAQGVQGDLHYFGRPLQDPLDFVAHGTFEASGRGEPGQFRQEGRDTVDVGSAAALVDGHHVHGPTLKG